MPSLTIGLSLAAMRPAGRGRWWASAAFPAADAGTGLMLGPAAILDFGGNRYAITEGWWELPAYAAGDADRIGRSPAAILDFSTDRYAR
ncbi:hypothetical protein JET14_08735 [Martelella lutilitoris]|uniref:Uncharacterized protein n=1 Tax=Martelella lutilitoris TaxID=2583532 RepID=A0A7T7HN26_9HYPH|nr:hypothetical protein [Martelella lutilitoris]QQM32205.1 hypothetical protein JET14_08735 [Martelella lutilitoris]